MEKNQVSFLITFLMCLSGFGLNGQVGNYNTSPSSLFESEDILEFTLIGNVEDLLRDRSGSAQDFDFELVEHTPKADQIRHFLEIKTRGHFRRLKGNCSYPPLQLDFSKNQVPDQSVFYKQNKLKLVMPCQGEKYVLREYLTYQIYNLLTPASFKARLVKVSFRDKESEKVHMSVVGILLEDEDQMAERNHAEVISRNLIRPEQIDKDNFNEVAIFQFLIGNTDWSVQYRQNIKILEQSETNKSIIVPYDFDHAGIVKAPYARPAPELQLGSVVQRRYRGYCVTDLETFRMAIGIYKESKSDFYEIIKNSPHLDQGSIKYCTKYLDGFFKIIENDKLWQRAFSYPCKKDGTGNVVIKGLRE